MSKKPLWHSKVAKRLTLERLESRLILAADAFPRHNVFEPEDVNDDGDLSPTDALIVVNDLNSVEPEAGGHFVDVNADGRRSPMDVLQVINRLNRRGERPRDNSIDLQVIPTAETETRALDGTGNNEESLALGSVGEQLLRIAPADYADGVSQPAGEDRPSAREISNVLSDQVAGAEGNARDTSAFLYVWGQFLDHDIDLTHSDRSGNDPFDIPVPTGDPFFDPDGTGSQVISFSRSLFDETTGTDAENPREQSNSITAWIDGSMVYGTSEEQSNALRALEGGRMLIGEDGLLPVDENGRWLAGDIRAGENISLTSMHVLFLHEHNYWADQIAAENPELTDEEVFQQARALVIAEIQAITYNEFLPALLGRNSLARYEGYNPEVNPNITTEFSTAAFRFGHSTINDDVEFFGNDGRAVRDEVALREAFFNPELLRETGIDSVLKYVASAQSEEIDLQVVDSLRNFLFGAPGQGGLDLVALNIQRGRDHGLADYNSVREAYGLARVESFDQITSDAELQQKLEDLYGDVDNIDLWVGGLAEDHLRGSSLGATFQAIVADQFERLRDGDRFWYQNIFAGNDLRVLERTELSDILQRHTSITSFQENVFYFRASVQGRVYTDLDGDDLFERGERGLESVTVELMDDQGSVVATTETDRRGRYRFDEFTETGDYQVRVAAAPELGIETDLVADFLVSRGNERIRGMDLSVSVLDQIAADIAGQRRR